MNTKSTSTAAAIGMITLCGAIMQPIEAVTLNESVSVEGYIGGSYRHLDGDDGFDTLDIDAAKLLFSTDFQPVTGVFSFFYAPGAPEDVTLLDAYASYSLDNGITISGGKFLSWHGYESFHIALMNQLTYATGDFLGAIPGYHAGVRLEQSGAGWAAGVAVLDSVYTPGGSYLKGDGELSDNVGFEAYYKYTGMDRLAVYVGAAYDTSGGFQPDDVIMLNVWSDYAINDALLVAGEFIYKDAGDAGDGWSWAGFANYQFTDTISAIFRLAGEYIDEGPDFLRISAAPTLSLTPNMLVRAELTYTDYTDFTDSSATFFGVQSIFKF